MHLLALALFFPETARNVVGNGSTSRSSLCGVLVSRCKNQAPSSHYGERRRSKRTVYWPNPLACLPIVLYWKSAIVMLIGGVYYTVFGCLAALLSTICIELYDLTYLEAGLVYLPADFGGILAAYSTGESFLNNHRQTSQHS